MNDENESPRRRRGANPNDQANMLNAQGQASQPSAPPSTTPSIANAPTTSTATSEPTKPETTQTSMGGLLDGIVVTEPSQVVANTRKYFCGVKGDLVRQDVRFNVGPACFCKETFAWKGEGENAQQIFRDGSIVTLSDQEVAEIREKLRYRYARPTKHKTGHVTFQEIEASDGGDCGPNGVDPRPAKFLPQRLQKGDFPLKALLVFHPVVDDLRNGRAFTVADAKKLLQDAMDEEARILQGGTAVFEEGKDGKLPAYLRELATVTANTGPVDLSVGGMGGYIG